MRVVNADAAVKLYASSFCTVSDVQVGVTKPRRGGRWNGRSTVLQQVDKDGHMGVALHWCGGAAGKGVRVLASQHDDVPTLSLACHGCCCLLQGVI